MIDRARLVEIRHRLARPSARTIAGAVLFLTADQVVYELAGSRAMFQGPLDETAHLGTTLVIFWAIRAPRLERFLPAALVASVAIDLDHVPDQLGHDWLTAGTSRPYTHSLTTVLVLLTLTGLRRRRVSVLGGLAIGVASHLWRDLAEPSTSGVALLWPLSDRSYSTPSALYLSVMAALAVTAVLRARPAARPAARDAVDRRRAQGLGPVLVQRTEDG